MIGPEYQSVAEIPSISVNGGTSFVRPTQTKRSQVSLQLQQFSTPLPLGYIAKVAAQITPDDLVLEPSAGTGILAAFALAGLDSFSTKSVPNGGEF